MPCRSLIPYQKAPNHHVYTYNQTNTQDVIMCLTVIIVVIVHEQKPALLFRNNEEGFEKKKQKAVVSRYFSQFNIVESTCITYRELLHIYE